MSYFKYLWVNRVKFPFGSKRFLRAWAKRLLVFGQLIKMSGRRRALVRLGAIIHPTVAISPAVFQGKKSNLSVGEFSFLGRVNIALHTHVTIGKFVCINDGALILTASHDVLDPEWKHKKAPVIIEDYAWVAMNTIILPGVTIGRGAVVAAGAVVSKNVEPFTIVAGNPAKPLSKNRTTTLNYNPCEFLAVNDAWLKG